MILSRIFARRRIAAGVRPGWVAAWGLVALDALALAVFLALLWAPFRGLAIRFDVPVWATIAALLALGFIPIQGVLIISSLWAAKSRWADKDDGPSGNA